MPVPKTVSEDKLTIFYPVLTIQKYTAIEENVVGKRENTDKQHFLLFPQCFHPVKESNHRWSYMYILNFNF